MSALVAQIARRRQAEALLAQTEEDDRLQLVSVANPSSFCLAPYASPNRGSPACDVDRFLSS